MAFKPGNSGRPKGSANKLTLKMKEWADKFGEQWVEEVWNLALTAEKQSDRLTALTLLGKKVLPDLKAVEHSGEVDTNVTQKSVDLSDLSTDELLVIQKVLNSRK